MGRRQFHRGDWIQFALWSVISIYHSGVTYPQNGVEMVHSCGLPDTAIHPADMLCFEA